MRTIWNVAKSSFNARSWLFVFTLGLLALCITVAVSANFLWAGQIAAEDTAHQLYALNLQNQGVSGSFLVVNNPNQVSAQVLLQFYQADGTPTTPSDIPGGNPFTLGAGLSKEIELATIGDLPSSTVLNASISSDQPVVALNRYRSFMSFFNREFHAISQVQASQEAATTLYVPDMRAIASASQQSTLVVFNPGDASANATVTLIDANGSTQNVQQAAINPKGSYSLAVQTVVPDGFRGLAFVTSTTPILVAHSLEGAAVGRQNGFSQGATMHYAPYIYMTYPRLKTIQSLPFRMSARASRPQ